MKWMPERTWNTIQSDSKRWTQRACTSCRRYGLESEGRLYTHQTVGCGMSSSVLALRFDLHGLRSKLSWISLMFFSDTRGRPELLHLLGQPSCSNWWFQRQMLFLVGGWMFKRRRNARCTAVAYSILMNSVTLKIWCCIVSILRSTDAAAPLCARRKLYRYNLKT